ncbi:MAG: hypothetical protein JW708_02820 [Vallitaleaceae bacterium]|nr:hypothetical protein [Vallitaleaceae bacterium]
MFILIFLAINLALFLFQGYYEENRYTLSPEKEMQLSKVLNSNGISIYKLIPSFYPTSQLELKIPSDNKETIVERVLGKKVSSRIEANGLGERVFTDKESLVFYVGDQLGLIYYTGVDEKYKPKNMTLSEVESVASDFALELFGDEVEMVITAEKATEDGYRIEMNEKYKDSIVFQSYIKMSITEKGIEEALATRYEPIGYVGQRKNIYPFDEIMYSLMYYLYDEIHSVHQSDDKLKKIVRDIDIGYYLIDSSTKEFVMQADPYYRVIFEDGDIYYINAYTNDIYVP